MSARDKDGHSLREILQGQIDRARTDFRRDELQADLTLPPFPEAIRYLWTAYWDMRLRCGGNGFGASPICWGDIDAFSRLTGARFAPWEIRVITSVDDVWLAASRTPMTPES